MVPPDSNRVSRVRLYSGANLVCVLLSHTGLSPCVAQLSRSILLECTDLLVGPTTPMSKTLVWAFPVSLAATQGISLDFFSSAYLDVSVRRVLLPYPMYSGKDNRQLSLLGFPIRRPPGQSFLTAHRSLSQVNASFIAC